MTSIARRAASVFAVLFGLLFSSIAHQGQPVWAQRPNSESAERYGGEAQVGSERPIPVHLEVRRSGETVEGVIRSEGAAFTIEGRGTDVVEATFGGEAGGGPIRLHFASGRVEGEFELGGERGTLRAEPTPLDADAFFAEPEQRLDLTAAEWEQDLDRLVEIMTTRHGAPFHSATREDFRRQVDRVRAALPDLSGPQVTVEFRKLGAMIGDGHTNVAAPQGRARLPIGAFWFEDGIRLVRIAAEHRELLGSILTAIDGIPIAEAVRRLRPYASQGESAWSYRYVAPFLFTDPDVLANAGIGSGSIHSFAFEGADGASRTISLAATVEPVAQAVLGGARPFWEREPSEDFRILRLADGSLYANWRGYERLRDRTSVLLAELDRDPPCRLIIDLRDSGGGDFNLGRQLVRELAERTAVNRPDRLFVLTGRRTFSAAMTNAVDFRTMTRATLVGEPPGAAPNNWQEVRSFHLPHSGLKVGVSTRYYEFLPGETAVRPDFFVPPTPSDWGSEHDAALRYILGLPCSRAG